MYEPRNGPSQVELLSESGRVLGCWPINLTQLFYLTQPFETAITTRETVQSLRLSFVYGWLSYRYVDAIISVAD